jgi:hypothetical protein
MMCKSCEKHLNNENFEKNIKQSIIIINQNQNQNQNEFSNLNYTHKNYFKYVANVELYNNERTKTSNQSYMKFILDMPDAFIKKTKCLYIFTINSKIIKIGGTINGLKNRCSSFLCGHHYNYTLAFQNRKNGNSLYKKNYVKNREYYL